MFCINFLYKYLTSLRKKRFDISSVPSCSRQYACELHWKKHHRGNAGGWLAVELIHLTKIQYNLCVVSVVGGARRIRGLPMLLAKAQARTGKDRRGPTLVRKSKIGCRAARHASSETRDVASRCVVTRVRVRARRRGEECANEGASRIIRGVHAWAARVYVSPPELRPEFRRRDRPQSAAVRTTPDSAPWRGAVRRPGIRGLRSLDGRRSAFFFLLATLIPRARREGRGTSIAVRVKFSQNLNSIITRYANSYCIKYDVFF